MRTEDDRLRVRRTIAMAARMVEMGDPDAQLVGKAVVTPLDADGRPAGPSVEIGPLIISMRSLGLA